MATQLLGGNRAYYTPSFFGSGNAAFDPSGGVGTAAIGESEALRNLIAAMMQAFTPGPARGDMGTGMDPGGAEYTPPGADTSVSSGSGSVIQDRETLANIAGLNQSLGMAASIPGLESLGGISEALGSISPVISAALAGTSDAARQEQTEISQRAWEALGGGLDISPIDYGSSGVNPAGAALAAAVPGIAALAGVNPVIGGLIGQGIRTAADPVPPTNQDVVGRLVDALMPGIVNAGVQLATGSTVGQNIKGALTPVEDAIAMTPEEVARAEAAGGRTEAGAPVETLTPVDATQIQAQADIQALQDAIAEDIANQGTIVNESPFANVQEMNKAFEQEMLAMGPSFAELTAGRAAEEAAAPIDMTVPASSGASMEPSVMQSIFDAMVDYQQRSETEGVTSAAESEGDFGFADASADGYGYID